MGLQRCTSTDAFVVTDLDDAPTADGVVRCARKVLVDGARTLARSRTYSWALLGEKVSGASAGVNAAGEGRDAALAAFVDEVAPRVEAGELSLDPAKGVTGADLSTLEAIDRRSDMVHVAGPGGRPLADELLAAGCVAAAAAVLGDLDGLSFAVEGAGAAGPALVAAVAAAGGKVTAVATSTGTVDTSDVDPVELAATWSEHGEALPAHLDGSDDPLAVLATAADVLACGSRAGLVDHEVAASLRSRVLVPVGPVPVTARGLAVATGTGTTVVADFLSLAAPLLAFRASAEATAGSLVADATTRIRELAASTLDHPETPFLGACALAEEFLGTWREQLPFGRPLA